MLLAYDPFKECDADYEALVYFANTESDVPRTVEDFRWQDSRRKPDQFSSREFVILDGKRIGTASCSEQTMTEAAGVRFIGLMLLPEYRDIGLETPIFEHLCDVSKASGGLVVTTYVRDDREGRCEALTGMGFERAMRDPMSELDLDGFDAARFAPTLREVERQGIVLRSIADLERESVDWMPSAHELIYELLQDVPMPDPPRRPSIDEFRERVRHPSWWFPEGWIVAFDGELWVGSSSLTPVPTQREMAMTGLTGVVRSHRRRGIATALKVTALECARQVGVRTVRTGNEENNPMLQLNLSLAFREVYAILIYRKRL
jgi:GNAT superfamily N-acetyltransferase